MGLRLLRFFGLVVTAIALLVAFSVSSSSGQWTPRLARAQVIAQQQTIASGIQVQNLSSTSAANVLVTFYSQNGTDKYQFVPQGSPIAANSTLNIYNPSQVPDGFTGSVFVEADQPIATIYRADWTGDKAAATYAAATAGATRYNVPLVVREYYGQNSRVTIQNVDPAGDATVNVQIYRSGNATPTKTVGPLTIKTGYSYTFEQSDMTDLGTRFIGSAVVTSDKNVVAVADVRLTRESGVAVYEYNGFSSGATKLFASLIRRNYFGYTTGIQIQNTGATETANVEVTYVGATKSAPNTTVTFTDTLTIAAGQSANLFHGNTDPARGVVLPDGFIGSATALSDQPIVGIVNDALFASGQSSSASYNMESAGATKLVVPLIRNVYPATPARLITGLQVMNVGTEATRIQVKYTPAPGRPALTADTDTTTSVASGQSWTFYSGNTSSSAGLVLPANFVGSAVVTSLDNQPLIGILNDASSTGLMDAAIFNALQAQ